MHRTHRDVVFSARAAAERSRSLNRASRKLNVRSGDLIRASRSLMGAHLTLLTEASDGGLEWPRRGAYLTLASRAVGRDPAIEQAKQILTRRYHVSPSEAFALLRSVSGSRNVKVAEVARRLVADEEAQQGVGAAPPGDPAASD